jgi:hypothetical protein
VIVTPFSINLNVNESLEATDSLDAQASIVSQPQEQVIVNNTNNNQTGNQVNTATMTEAVEASTSTAANASKNSPSSVEGGNISQQYGLLSDNPSKAETSLLLNNFNAIGETLKPSDALLSINNMNPISDGPSRSESPALVNVANAWYLIVYVMNGGDGSVSPVGLMSVASGSGQTLNATPNAGKSVSGWTLNGTAVNGTNTTYNVPAQTAGSLNIVVCTFT